ncbi:MAG TPA: mandelate racemase/muconate lactonizing enzyme family protein [Burkholderiales bacterium]|nr:mandelate racemase/muconate lactonizing enzyme family protein [Burkholderiales bacterium]
MPIEPGEHRTSWGDYPSVSIVLVEVTTDTGLVGYGEALSRRCPQSTEAVIMDLLRPVYLGQNPFDTELLWSRVARLRSGKLGGALVEAIAAVDTALWDVMGKATGQPVHALLGGMGRTKVDAYASALSWNAEENAMRQLRAALANNYTMIKVKLGSPVEKALEWARHLREQVPSSVRLCADANCAYDLDDAIRVGRGLLDLDYYWLEEPLACDDIEGYRLLRASVPIRIAAGEGEHTSTAARQLIADRSIGIVQPDCARAGGITETRKIVTTAHVFNVAYAPHVGAGGAVSAAANLQLAAAMPNFLTYESMIFPSPLRDELATTRVGAVDPTDGRIFVPQGPGLGIEIDRNVLEKYRAPARRG